MSHSPVANRLAPVADGLVPVANRLAPVADGLVPSKSAQKPRFCARKEGDWHQGERKLASGSAAVAVLQITARANPCSRHLWGTLARAVASI